MKAKVANKDNGRTQETCRQGTAKFSGAVPCVYEMYLVYSNENSTYVPEGHFFFLSGPGQAKYDIKTPSFKKKSAVWQFSECDASFVGTLTSVTPHFWRN